ncbi:MAG TPA: acetylxylan esterase, partial [Planctomycetaceae bacterium]|nr:acetylxylan esterase [Planctomycetaceae bacterium]
MRRSAWIAGALALALSWSAAAGEQPDLKALLEQRVVEPERVLEEVQVFTESRVVPMPEPRSAAEWEEYVARLRRDVFDRVVFRGEAAKWRDADVKVEWLDEIEGGPGYRIRKLRYEALPGLWIPALLYEPEQLDGKVPVVMNVNGHDGNGKAADYKQIRCINQAKRGMLALNVEWLGMGQLRGEDYVHYRMNQLDLCGTSGLAPFYLSMQRGLDVLLAHEHADAARVAVAGLSGGGWQTIVISALDERVTLSNPVAGYSSFLTRARNFSDLGDSEQTPVDLGAVADYHHLTAMRAPRPTLLTYNANDQCCFKADHALPPLMAAAQPIFALYGKQDALRSHVNSDPGTHNFELDNRQQLYRMFGDFFFGDRDGFDGKEIPSESEVKSKDDLNVPLPDDNASFRTLAVALARELPRAPALPTERDFARKWQAKRRAILAEIVRAETPDVTATAVETLDGEGTLRAKTWRLRVGDDWTVPAVELVRDARRTEFHSVRGNPDG